MFEVELKFRLREPALTKQALEANGCTFQPAVTYHDMYFDDRERSLSSKDGELRIREIRSEHGTRLRTQLTAKGRRLRTESETKLQSQVFVESPEEARRVLELIGFQSWIRYEKHVLIGSLRYNEKYVTASIVNVPELNGDFLEIEVAAGSDKEFDLLEGLLLEIAGKIGLGRQDLEHGYYTEAVLLKRK